MKRTTWNARVISSIPPARIGVIHVTKRCSAAATHEDIAAVDDVRIRKASHGGRIAFFEGLLGQFAVRVAAPHIEGHRELT